MLYQAEFFRRYYESPSFSAIGFAILFCLYTFERDKYVDYRPVVYSVRAHAKKFGLSSPQVLYALNQLGAQGFIKVDTVTGKSQKRFSTTVKLLTEEEINQFIGAEQDA